MLKAQEQLKVAEDQLKSVQDELKDTKDELKKTKDQLKFAEHRIAVMKNSGSVKENQDIASVVDKAVAKYKAKSDSFKTFVVKQKLQDWEKTADEEEEGEEDDDDDDLAPAKQLPRAHSYRDADTVAALKQGDEEAKEAMAIADSKDETYGADEDATQEQDDNELAYEAEIAEYKEMLQVFADYLHDQPVNKWELEDALKCCLDKRKKWNQIGKGLSGKTRLENDLETYRKELDDLWQDINTHCTRFGVLAELTEQEDVKSTYGRVYETYKLFRVIFNKVGDFRNQSNSLTNDYWELWDEAKRGSHLVNPEAQTPKGGLFLELRNGFRTFMEKNLKMMKIQDDIDSSETQKEDDHNTRINNLKASCYAEACEVKERMAEIAAEDKRQKEEWQNKQKNKHRSPSPAPPKAKRFK